MGREHVSIGVPKQYSMQVCRAFAPARDWEILGMNQGYGTAKTARNWRWKAPGSRCVAPCMALDGSDVKCGRPRRPRERVRGRNKGRRPRCGVEPQLSTGLISDWLARLPERNGFRAALSSACPFLSLPRASPLLLPSSLHQSLPSISFPIDYAHRIPSWEQ
jgi:hypothetical protein